MPFRVMWSSRRDGAVAWRRVGDPYLLLTETLAKLYCSIVVRALSTIGQLQVVKAIVGNRRRVGRLSE